MRLIMGNTEIDFSVINHSDLVFNKSIEIPLQDLLAVCKGNSANATSFDMDVVNITSKNESELAKAYRQIELVEEQMFFARELWDSIQQIIKHYPNTGGAKTLKAGILTAIQESLFER